MRVPWKSAAERTGALIVNRPCGGQGTAYSALQAALAGQVFLDQRALQVPQAARVAHSCAPRRARHRRPAIGISPHHAGHDGLARLGLAVLHRLADLGQLEQACCSGMHLDAQRARRGTVPPRCANCAMIAACGRTRRGSRWPACQLRLGVRHRGRGQRDQQDTKVFMGNSCADVSGVGDCGLSSASAGAATAPRRARNRSTATATSISSEQRQCAVRAIQVTSRRVRPWITNRLKPTGGVICAISTTSTMKMPNQIRSKPAASTVGSSTAMVSTTMEMPSRKQPSTMKNTMSSSISVER